jgi:hypothetical protein
VKQCASFRHRERLVAKPAKTIRNWQPDNEHVHQQSLKQPMKLVWPCCTQCAERQHNQVHHQINSDSKEYPANQKILFQNPQRAARQAVHRRGSERDEVLEKHAENPYARATVNRLPAQQSRRNYSRNIAPIGDERRDQVKRAGHRASHKNRDQKPVSLDRC